MSVCGVGRGGDRGVWVCFNWSGLIDASNSNIPANDCLDAAHVIFLPQQTSTSEQLKAMSTAASRKLLTLLAVTDTAPAVVDFTGKASDTRAVGPVTFGSPADGVAVPEAPVNNGREEQQAVYLARRQAEVDAERQAQAAHDLQELQRQQQQQLLQDQVMQQQRQQEQQQLLLRLQQQQQQEAQLRLQQQQQQQQQEAQLRLQQLQHQQQQQQQPQPPSTASNTPVNSGSGNRWIKHMLKTPADQVTGTVNDVTALASGTFSDEVSWSACSAPDRLVLTCGGADLFGAVRDARHAPRTYSLAMFSFT